MANRWPRDLDDRLPADLGSGDEVEPVVLLDDAGNPTGTTEKATAHHAATPLHLGFSCYLLDDCDRLLLTRRAAAKRTWPGVWTNTCCGHPMPGESLREAVTRRLAAELGTAARDLVLVLPDFRYRAEKDAVVENELCPVVVGRVDGDVRPAADEVGATRWLPRRDLAAELAAGEVVLSPWALAQLPLLDAAGWGRRQETRATT